MCADNDISGLSNGLSKEERLHHKISINSIFTEGNFFKISPFKVFYHFNDKIKTPPVRIMISVPKKIHSSAPERNHIKRLVRESYRKNKSELAEKMKKSGKTLDIAFIYLDPEIRTFAETESKIILTLQRLLELTDKEFNL